MSTRNTTRTTCLGILHCGFFAHTALKHTLAAGRTPLKATRTVACCVLCSALVVAPLVVFQWHGVRVFCDAHSRHACTLQPAWCPRSSRDWIWPSLYQYVHMGNKRRVSLCRMCNSTPPIPLRAVQARYWNVGFLRFYTLQQLPNMALAAPMLVLTGACMWRAMSSSPRHVLTCGLLGDDVHTKQRRRCNVVVQDPVFLWQWMGMALVALLFMHVHVVTRYA